MSDMNITGLCHSVQGTAEMLAKWIGAEEKQVRYTCAGINHQAFYLDFEVDGKDAYPDLYKAIEREEVAAEEPKCSRSLDILIQNRRDIIRNMWHGLENVPI